MVVSSLSFGKCPLEALGSNGALRATGAWNDGIPAAQSPNSDPQQDCTYAGFSRVQVLLIVRPFALVLRPDTELISDEIETPGFHRMIAHSLLFLAIKFCAPG